MGTVVTLLTVHCTIMVVMCGRHHLPPYRLGDNEDLTGLEREIVLLFYNHPYVILMGALLLLSQFIRNKCIIYRLNILHI